MRSGTLGYSRKIFLGASQQWLFKTNDPVLVEKTLFSELQGHTAGHLESLIRAVQALKTAEACMELQQQLAVLLFQIEEIEHAATQKLRAGYDIDVRAEQFAAGRAARQLRTIGDALAWMVTGGDRRAITALSQNDGPGRIFGKGQRGLAAELRAVNAFWGQGHFALLHDVTNCLRIDDITVCNRLHRLDVPDNHVCPKDEFGLTEVKANRHAKKSPEQRQRHEAALAAINQAADIQTVNGLRKQFRWTGGYENHDQALARVLEAAMLDGVAGEVIEDGWVISAVRFVDWPKGTSAIDIIGSWEARRARLLGQAGMTGAPAHRLQTGDAAGRMLRCVPYALFPMAPKTTAFLTSDWLIFDSTLSIPYLESKLRAAGMEVERQDPDGLSLLASVEGHAIQIHRASVEHALAELVQIDVLARALASWAAEPGFIGDGELILDIRQ
jgi:hypothetical protein